MDKYFKVLKVILLSNKNRAKTKHSKTIIIVLNHGIQINIHFLCYEYVAYFYMKKEIHHISCGSKYDLIEFYTINLLIEKNSAEARYHKSLG